MQDRPLVFTLHDFQPQTHVGLFQDKSKSNDWPCQNITYSREYSNNNPSPLSSDFLRVCQRADAKQDVTSNYIYKSSSLEKLSFISSALAKL